VLGQQSVKARGFKLQKPPFRFVETSLARASDPGGDAFDHPPAGHGPHSVASGHRDLIPAPARPSHAQLTPVLSLKVNGFSGRPHGVAGLEASLERFGS
jgi:hypothetical protein